MRCLTHTGPARPCSTASTGGASAACGRSCSQPSSPARTRPGSPWSTAPPCAPIAPPRAAKGGPEPGDRAVARRTDNQDPRDRRPGGSDRSDPADARAGCRRQRRTHPARRDPGARRPDRRQGLRRRRSPGVSHPARHAAGDLADAEPLRHPAPFDVIAYRQRNLIERAFCAQGLAGNRHPLRQDRPQFPRRDLPRRRAHLVDQMSPQPSLAAAGRGCGPRRGLALRGPRPRWCRLARRARRLHRPDRSRAGAGRWLYAGGRMAR